MGLVCFAASGACLFGRCARQQGPRSTTILLLLLLLLLPLPLVLVLVLVLLPCFEAVNANAPVCTLGLCQPLCALSSPLGSHSRT